MFLHYSSTDTSSTSFGETGSTEGNKVVYVYLPLHITSKYLFISGTHVSQLVLLLRFLVMFLQSKM